MVRGHPRIIAGTFETRSLFPLESAGSIAPIMGHGSNLYNSAKRIQSTRKAEPVVAGSATVHLLQGRLSAGFGRCSMQAGFRHPPACGSRDP